MKLACSSVLALTVAATVAARADNPPPPDGVEALGDHYACYTAKADPVSLDMVLKDQFGTFKFHATAVSRLCNPVAKTFKGTTTTVKNPTLHYVCYTGTGSPTVTHTVAVTNQFGSNKLAVRGPNEVCVPSTKKVIQ